MKDKPICMYYICKGSCSKGRDAEVNGVCKNCKKYRARKGATVINKKKENKYKYYE